jgi:hypothetical protein
MGCSIDLAPLSFPVDAGPLPWTMPTRPLCETTYGAPPLVAGLLPRALVEMSGQVASPSGQDVLWMHNDSGDRARVFAVRRDGGLLGELTIDDVTMTDVEDIAAGPCPDGSGPCLLLADTGDNGAVRSDAHLVFVREPALDVTNVFASMAAENLWDVPLSYDDGPVDVEAVAFTPDGARVLLIEKADAEDARVFDVDGPFVDGVPVFARTRTRIHSPGLVIPMGRMITAADLHPSSRAMLLRTYTGLFELRVDDEGSDEELLSSLLEAAPTLLSLGPLRESQGEAIAYDVDGTTVLSASEDLSGAGGQPLLAMPCLD